MTAIKQISISGGAKVLFSVLLFCCLIASMPSCNRDSVPDDSYYDSAMNRAIVANRSGDHARAIQLADSVFFSVHEPSSFLKYKRYCFKSSDCFLNRQPDAGRLYLDSMVYAMERWGLKEKYQLYYASSLTSRGDVYFNNNNLDSAFDFYYRSRSAQQAVSSDSCTLSNYSYHLGMISYRQEKYQQSVQFFKQSFKQLAFCEQDSLEYNRAQELLSNTGLAYCKLKAYDSAEYYYRFALKFIDSVGGKYDFSKEYRRLSRIARGVVLGNLAKIYVARGANDTAIALLTESIAINAVPGYELYDAQFSNMQLAEVYFKEGDFSKLLPVMADLRAALDTMDNAAVNMRWYELMYRYHKAEGHTAAALAHLEVYRTLEAASDSAMKALKSKDYGGLLRDQEAQFEIELLKKDNQLSKLYLLSTFGVVAVALIIIGLVYYSYRRGRRNIAMLTSLNEQVNEQKTQLEEAMVQLKENNDEKDRILRIVAHDLRTPINGIMMISDFTLEDEEDLGKRESLNMIISASKNLLHLTNELLEFSGNQKYSDTVVMEDTNLNELIRQSVGLLTFKAQEKKQIITVQTVPYPVIAHVHREKISRVVSNLISNALKFSKEGALVKVGLSVAGDKALIMVEDFGLGIPAHLLPLVFDPFTTAKRHGTSGERSYGLGLSICKQIVNLHNGRIWVDSQEGQGSIFYVELTIKPQTDSTIAE